MKSKRRIRCLCCKKLVMPKINYYEPDEPYSVIPINYQKKHGCVCSECIERYAADDDFLRYSTFSENELTESKRMDLLFGPFAKMLPPRNSQVVLMTTHDLSKEKANDSRPLQANAANEQIPSHSTKTSSSTKSSEVEQKDLYLEKYSCLDYSLDSYANLVQNVVFGQEEAVKRLIYTVYFNQLANCLEEYSDMLPPDSIKCLGHDKTPPRRKHVLLIGNTGVGKTLLASTVAKMFKITYSISNATPITSAGYIGDKIENVLERLYDAADGDIQVAQNGIIILDEFDKKAVSPNETTRDVTGKAVQQELLKLLEPTDVWIRKGTVKFNTKNLTIIMMGAFVGLEDVVTKRLNVKRIGFGNNDTSISLDKLIPDDLIEYGFIPEIVGRIPIVIKLNNLTKDVLTDIVYALLNKYNLFFKYKNYDLIVDQQLIDKLVEESLSAKTGARDLDTKVDELLQPALYQVFQSLPNGVCEVNSDGSITLLRSQKDSVTPSLLEISPTKKYEDFDDEDITEK